MHTSTALPSLLPSAGIVLPAQQLHTCTLSELRAWMAAHSRPCTCSTCSQRNARGQKPFRSGKRCRQTIAPGTDNKVCAVQWLHVPAEPGCRCTSSGCALQISRRPVPLTLPLPCALCPCPYPCPSPRTSVLVSFTAGPEPCSTLLPRLLRRSLRLVTILMPALPGTWGGRG